MIKGGAGFDQLVGGAVAGEIFGNHKTSAILSPSPANQRGRGDAGGGEQLESGDFTIGRRSGTARRGISLDMQADRRSIIARGVQRAVFAIVQLPPSLNLRMI